MLGLAQPPRRARHSTVCSFPNEPLDPPRWAALLPGRDRLVPPAAFPAAPEVMVTCDCASFDRLGRLGATASAARELIWIDHHRSNDGQRHDPPGRPRRVVHLRGGGPADRRDRRRAHRAIGDLPVRRARHGHRPVPVRGHDTRDAPPRRAAARAAASTTPAWRRRCSRTPRRVPLGVLGRRARPAREHRRGRAGLDVPPAGRPARGRRQPGETDDLIDVIRTSRDADVAAVLKQQRDGRFKVSVRSRGDHDLAAVAAAFGGGGHRLAAGYTSERGPAGTIERPRGGAGRGRAPA